MFEVVRGIPHVSLMPVHSYEVEMIYLLIDPITERTQSSICLLYTSPSPRDQRGSRMPSSA